MILVTTAKNDKPLVKQLGDQATPAAIPYGDVFWYGVWSEGATVAVCGDRKRMHDFLNCVENGHHVQQIQDARQGGADFIFVVWERDKPMRANPLTGNVQLYYYKKGWYDRMPLLHINRVLAYKNELQYYQGVPVFETRSLRETTLQILSLYKMFLTPPEEHHALDVFYNPPPPKEGLLWKRPSLVRRLAKEFDGVGWTRSKAFESRFKTPEELIWALATPTVESLTEIEGIGKVTAQSIISQLEGQ